MEGYCSKCRAQQEITEAKNVTLRNGMPAVEGVCPNCGTRVFRIGKVRSGNRHKLLSLSSE